MATDEQRPPLRIVRGEPTAEEIAVLAALMSVAGGGDDPVPAERRGGWNDPAASHRRALRAGPNGWRSSLN